MDSSWQMKCSSAWSSQLSVPPSSQIPASGSRNQMDTNKGHYFHPHNSHEGSSLERSIIQEPLVFSTLNLGGARKSSKPELGDSFLALLSGPSQQLQCEFQQLSNSKIQTHAAFSKLPVHDSIGAGGGFPVTCLGSLSQLHGNQSMGNGSELSPAVASRVFSTSICSPVAVLHSNLQRGSLNLRGADYAKPVLHHAVCGNETGIEVSPLKWECLAGASPANSSKQHTSNFQILQKPASEAKCTEATYASLARKHPRVFCLGTSGVLLLNDMGFLGVVCLCHSLHMSVAKFSEHSGSCGVNPGDAVHLESGETIAQWRRIYFFKFGMRVPDDNSGWEWPEGISAPGGLVKCNVTTLPSMSRKNTFQQVDSFGGMVRSGQPWNDFQLPNNPYMGQSMLENPFNMVMHNAQAQQRNALDGPSALKSFIGTSHGIFPALAANQSMHTVKKNGTPRDPITPKYTPDKGLQTCGNHAVAGFSSFASKCANPFLSDPSSGNLKSFCTNSDISRGNSSREALLKEKDAVSSNIELRLGQPSQRAHALVGSIPSVMRAQSFGAPCDSQKSQFYEPIVHRAVNPRVTEEGRQNLLCSPLETSYSNRREKESQFNLMSHPVKSINAMDPSKSEHLKGDATKSSLMSMFLSHFSASSGGNIQSKATDNMANNGQHFLTRVLDGDSRSANCDPTDLLRHRIGGIESKLNTNGAGLSNHVDNGQGSRSIDDYYSYIAEKPNSCHLVGVSGHCVHSSSSVLDRQPSHLHQSSGLLVDASNARNPANYFGKASRLRSGDHIDHVFHRCINSTPAVTDGSGLPSSAGRLGFSSTNPINLPNFTSSLSDKKGIDVSPQLLDENLKLLALRHIVELSKQEHSVASLEMDLEEGWPSCSPAMEMQRKGPKEGTIESKDVRQGSYLINKEDASEVAIRQIQPSFNRYLTGGLEKLGGAAGSNNCCNFSTSTPGVSLCSKELDVQCLPSRDRRADEQPFLRLGRTENTTDSGEQEKCRQKESHPYFLGKCSCAVQSKCLAGSCVSRAETPIDPSKEHLRSVGGQDHVDSEDRRIAKDHAESFKRHVPVKNVCRSAQWIDVPRKVIGNHGGTFIERPVEILDTKGMVEDQLADTAAKGFDGTSQEAESLREQQMSNVCSGCSAPAVTEISVEVNNVDSYTGESREGRFVNNLVVDEGSGIEKCCSSDDALGSGKFTETISVTGKIVSTKVGFPSTSPTPSPLDLIDKLKFKNSCRMKKMKSRIQAGYTGSDLTSHARQLERDPLAGNKKRAMKWKKLDASVPVSGLSSVHYDSPNSNRYSRAHLHMSKEIEMPARANHGMEKTHCIYSGGTSSLKRQCSSLSSGKILSRKRDLHGFEGHCRESEADYQTQLLRDDVPFLIKAKNSTEKKVKWDGKRLSVDAYDKKARPVVCSDSGIISNGKSAGGFAKPVKIASLRSILKIAKRCTITENEMEPRQTEKASFSTNERCYGELPLLKKQRDNNLHSTILNNEKASFSTKEGCLNRLVLLEKEKGNGGHQALKPITPHGCSNGRMNLGFKEARKRCVKELRVKCKHAKKPVCFSRLGGDEYSQLIEAGLHPKASSHSVLIDALGGKRFSFAKLCHKKRSKCILKKNYTSYGKTSLKIADDSQCYTGELYEINAKRSSIKGSKSPAYPLDSNAFCCVCGSSNKDEVNRLLECSRCLIRVHQACYGIAKVPKGCWSCRPCRTSSKNIVCVLCGYDGGAMTHALRSQNIVKGLLKAWNVGEGSNYMKSISLSKTVHDELGVVDPSSGGGPSGLEEADTVPAMGSTDVPRVLLETDLQNQINITGNSSSSNCNFQVHNTITAGILDSTVKQWVHMVCGLWTPGTRCPNVDTMSAFDVSGVSFSRKNMVCSMCDRPGGSCIRCRVVNCSVHFHPWCAHQKGLLQSEIEGVDNEKVGFYGRCLLHATHSSCHTDSEPLNGNSKVESPREKEFTCARTEGFKGRKKGEGFRHNFHVHSNDNSGCLVPQEQINAWLHINGQKSCTRGLVKPPTSDVEHDCRKEYARYKQAKGWKHLVVYKSGIHALGLYTSQFISRGAMVVEYVGEIVGLRVADKREIEYMSGRKVQYKSACYFFRIDKEHIIDATRKGGIARFVNHSCLPNCVAKVISVRNEKKVVFFAERDINPGEEITYDYHFNHEDEGEKIPCFCNSKNCRRYLN
ncbi:uncharacterized protein LOC143879490 isoform X2 [Tasmannia lanceolata]|uniref:uncharacterized protein LOC143879490 isoform X2 n=1 Tax=Tasmannia lanceolata TaxID=3420 RepID=UPI00406356D1